MLQLKIILFSIFNLPFNCKLNNQRNTFFKYKFYIVITKKYFLIKKKYNKQICMYYLFQIPDKLYNT